MNDVYKRTKNRITIPGFRKGRVPRKMVEQYYGKGVFLEDAVNGLLPKAYGDAAEESGLEIVSAPQIDFTQVEPGKDLIFTAEVAVKPEVKLGEYKGLEVPAADVTVTDEDVEAELKKEQEKNSRTIPVEDRAAQMGDTAVIDFDGSVDGVAFDGGKGENYNLVLGSGSFIPGFEEQVVGMKAGDEGAVNVTFPEDYHAADLAGKAAVFQVKVNRIETKELPALDDDFAQDVSEFDTLDEYKAEIRKNLTAKKEANAASMKQNAALLKAIANAEMDIPAAMVQTRAEQEVENYARRMQGQGMSFDQYCELVGTTRADFVEQMKPQIQQQIEASLVIEAIAKAENIEVSDEEVEAEFASLAETYKISVDNVKAQIPVEGIREDLANRKASELLAATAVEAAAEETAE